MDCPVCGNEVVRRTGRGAPAQYDAKDCRELAAFLSVVEGLIGKVQPKATPEAGRRLRSLLWKTANLLNGGIPRGERPELPKCAGCGRRRKVIDGYCQGCILAEWRVMKCNLSPLGLAAAGGEQSSRRED